MSESRYLFIFFLLLFGIPYADAITINAASCSLQDVQNAVNSADNCDTVSVPEGSCTWATPLSITKGIHLAGSGSTTIKRGGSHMIQYIPSDYSLDLPFRLSGFSFNGAGGDILKLGKELYPDSKPAQTKVRVDSNRFFSSTRTDMNDIAIEHFGNIFGVVESNIIEDYAYPMRNQNPSAYGVLWDAALDGSSGNVLFIPGSEYNLYFEDNSIKLYLSGGEASVTNSQFEGRYAYRYNNISIPSGGQSWYMFDVHPYNDPSMHAPFGSENYGNRLISGGSSVGYVNIRGGTNVWHHNSATSSVSYSTSGTAAACPPAKYRSYEPVTRTYFWGNRVGVTGPLEGASFDGSDAYSCNGHMNPAEGVDFFDDVDSSPRISCGPLMNMPASCSVGQGYWATDQSCTNLTGMVGINPATPISGTLYICTSQNTWTSWYTPYTYPHPLRLEGSCADRGGTCCPTGHACSSGTFTPASDCSTCCLAECNGCVPVTFSQLQAMIDSWKQGLAGLSDLMALIRQWKSGCQ